jgi:CheY-like chemotaxis protein
VAKILVVDDNDAIRSLCEDVLTEEGHVVATAADGFSGLALYEQLRPNIVITDLRLPGCSGLEIIERLRGEAGVRIIAISGSGAEHLAAARQMGAIRTLQKPFLIEDLADAVTELVGVAPPV